MSELKTCRKTINGEHWAEKIGKCVRLDVKLEHDVGKMHPMCEVRGYRA
jgi:hypothetical protein